MNYMIFDVLTFCLSSSYASFSHHDPCNDRLFTSISLLVDFFDSLVSSPCLWNDASNVVCYQISSLTSFLSPDSQCCLLNDLHLQGLRQ